VIHFLIAHVTILLIVAFFILFAASKADGLIKLFGTILGAWVVIVALLHVVGYFVPGMMGAKGPGMWHEGMMREHWMHHWGEQAPAPAAVPVQPAPAPATPAPKAPAPKKP
jgi:hypothetical protein